MSWIGVIVGAIVALLVVWVWYSPRVFGAKWAEGSGLDLGDVRKLPASPLIVPFIGLFPMSWLVGVTAVNNALLAVILATAAFCVMYYANGMFGRRSAYARGVDVGYRIVSPAIMIIAQGIFRTAVGPAIRPSSGTEPRGWAGYARPRMS